MRPVWRSVPFTTAGRLNLLLVPWPTTVSSRAFCPVKLKWHDMPRRYGYFTYKPDPTPAAFAAAELVKRLLEKAAGITGRINGIIFPELALTKTE